MTEEALKDQIHEVVHSLEGNISHLIQTGEEFILDPKNTGVKTKFQNEMQQLQNQIHQIVQLSLADFVSIFFFHSQSCFKDGFTFIHLFITHKVAEADNIARAMERIKHSQNDSTQVDLIKKVRYCNEQLLCFI